MSGDKSEELAREILNKWGSASGRDEIELDTPGWTNCHIIKSKRGGGGESEGK